MRYSAYFWMCWGSTGAEVWMPRAKTWMITWEQLSFVLWMCVFIQIHNPLLFWENDMAWKQPCSGDPADHWIISVSWGFLTCWEGKLFDKSTLAFTCCFVIPSWQQSKARVRILFWLVSSSFHLSFFFFFFLLCELPFSEEQELQWPWAMRCSVLHFPLCPQLFSYSIIWNNPVLLHGGLSSSSRLLLSLVREWGIFFCYFCWKFTNYVVK